MNEQRNWLIHQLSMEDLKVYRLMALETEELIRLAKSYGIEL